MTDLQISSALSKLPQTKDGAPIYPTMELFISSKLMGLDIRCSHDAGDGIISVVVASIKEWPVGVPQVFIQATWHGGEQIDPKMFYSSKEAALAGGRPMNAPAKKYPKEKWESIEKYVGEQFSPSELKEGLKGMGIEFED